MHYRDREECLSLEGRWKIVVRPMKMDSARCIIVERSIQDK